MSSGVKREASPDMDDEFALSDLSDDELLQPKPKHQKNEETASSSQSSGGPPGSPPVEPLMASEVAEPPAAVSVTSSSVQRGGGGGDEPDVTMPPDGIVENEDGTFSCYVIIPAGKAGMVIGTGGTTVKQMMAESKTRMNLVQDSVTDTGADKPLRIVGDRPNVLKAKEMVLHLVNEGGAPSFVDLHVPKFAVGMIIGNRGATINKLQDEYEVRIQIKPDQNPQGSYRVCQILGEPAKYQNAAQKVLDLVSAVEARDKARGVSHDNGLHAPAKIVDSSGKGSEKKANDHEVHMTVPERAVGRVIGKGGETIRRLMREAGCHIEMDKQNANSKDGKIVFILTGAMSCIEEAQDLINDVVKNRNQADNRGNRDGGGGRDRFNRDNNRDSRDSRDRQGGRYDRQARNRDRDSRDDRRWNDRNGRDNYSRDRSDNNPFGSGPPPPPAMPPMPPMPGMPPMMPPPFPGMPGMPPFGMPMMPGMPPMMPPMPPMPSQGFPSMPSMSWPGFPPMPSQQSSNPSNPFDMWANYMRMQAPASQSSHSESKSSSGGGGGNSQDAWMKCYKIFMDTMQDKSSSSSSSRQTSSSEQPPAKKDYTKEWQEYMAKMYSGGNSGQSEAWKKWTEQYQDFMKNANK